MGTESGVSDSPGRSRRRFLLAAGSTVVAGTGGCLVRGEDSGLSGQIIIDGSDTLFPHTAAIAEEFQWENNRVRIPVRGSGTGAGFQKFCAGETHIQDASRRITESEREQCRLNGIDWIEMPVVLDGIAVMKHPGNDWCECLTVDQLSQIWQSGSDVETWSDVEDDWPDEEIALFGRDSASGTFDYFTEKINGEAGDIRTDYTASADTNVVVRGVRGDPHAIGWGGAAYYTENEDDLGLIGVDDGSGCATPTREAIEEGEYTPLSRPMFLYVKTDELEREEVRAFLRFYLDHTQEIAPDVGYYAIPDADVEESRETLENAIEEHA